MKAVFGAMLLAALSSVAAFLSNAVSGTEAIVEFGIGSAVALAAAYIVLGQVAPRALLAAEVLVGAGPRLRWSRPAYWIGQVVVAVIGGLAVALAAVMPSIGTVAVASLALIAGVISAIAARRRNRRAMARGAALRDEALGSGHGIRSVGSLVAALAARRIVTVPVIVVVAILSLTSALKVKSGFEVNDFLASDTDFAQSIERTAEHFPSSGEGSSFILVEGNLTDPAALASLEDAVAGLDSSDARFGRRSSGELIVGWHAADLVRMTTSSPRARHDLAASGVTIVDENGDGIPDTADQVRAVYDYIALEGVLALDGSPAVIPADMGAILYDDGSRSQATAIVIQVGSFTDGAIIEPVRGALEDAAAAIETDVAGLSAGVSGDVLTQFVSLESFTRSMLVALPLAILLTLLVAAAVLRSLRYAIAAVVPIGFVVSGLYAFMAVAGYTVNVVTATIAAIAVGVGIDFSTHFTARFREELAGRRDRLAAIRRAGEGTGGALVLSAVTSVLGFLVMAQAPTPIFATFGALTAVMIGLALIASLVVLPSVLMLVTPGRHDQAVVGRDPAVRPEPVAVSA